jgi:hypothetical protein
LVIAVGGIIVVIAAGFTFSFVGKPPVAKDIVWGVNFSRLHSELLGLDWKTNYLALLDELGVRYFRIPVYWQDVESKEGEFRLDDYDWMINEAEKRNAKIILTVGRKVPRWPECHMPDWARELSEEDQQAKILFLIEHTVSRYKESAAIFRWQVENEVFFPFGVCPEPDMDFYKKEIDLVRSLDLRPIVVADSGEGSWWFGSAKLGDVVGTTMYKKVWVHQIGKYFTWPFQPIFYWRKAEIIRKIFGDEVIVVEFQAEPWGPKLLYDVSLEEMEKTMNLDQFKFMVDFGRRTGLREFYFWGSEWWYWMKENQNRPEIWEEARKIFNESKSI